jgi:hypothetical protein
MEQSRRAAALFSFIVGLAFSTQAQQTPGAAGAATPTSLTPAQWKAVEGYYQSASNKSLYIQSIAHDGVLLVKYMWMKNVDTLRPLSDRVFVPKKQSGGKSPRTVFAMDPGGTAISNNYSGFTWNRVAEYKPVAMKVMPHTPAQLERFAGVYYSPQDSNALIQITVEGNDLASFLRRQIPGKERLRQYDSAYRRRQSAADQTALGWENDRSYAPV